MAVDFEVETVPEGLEEHYEKSESGKFVLVVNGQPDLSADLKTAQTEAEEAKSKVKEFRQHNVTLRQQLEAATKTEGGEPPNIDALIEDAVSEMKQKMSTTEQERLTLQSQLEEVVLSDKVKDIAIQHGVYETALSDIVTRSKNVFTVKDGKPLPKDGKARDANGELLTPNSWIIQLQESAPHLFKPSTGTGATRPVRGGAGKDTRTAAQRIADGLNSSNKSAKTVM